jgi:poly(hydroxyalkanoate) granule-associated protein
MKTISEVNKSIQEANRKAFMAGLGLVLTVADRSKSVFDNLVEKGRETSEKNESSKFTQAVGRVKAVGDKANDQFQAGLAKTMGRLGIPTRQEIRELTLSVEKLTAKVQNLQTETA